MYRLKTEDEIRKIGERLCKKNGYDLIEMRKLPNQANDYLRYVLAHNEGSKEYVTWLLNLSVEGLYYGHYFSYRHDKTQKEIEHKAFSDFQIRQ